MQQDTMKHAAVAIMDPETKGNMFNHLAEYSYEELKARVFNNLVYVKGITYEEPKAWGAQLNYAGDGGTRDSTCGQSAE